MDQNLRHSLLVALLVTWCCLAVSSLGQQASAQSIESDDGFEAYHHDIGRINPASPSSSQVSPASIVKQTLVPQQPVADHAPVAASAPVVAPVASPVQTARQHSRSRLRPTGSARLSGASQSGGVQLPPDVSDQVRAPLAAAPVPVVAAPLPPLAPAPPSPSTNNQIYQYPAATSQNQHRLAIGYEQPTLASYSPSTSAARQQPQRQVAAYQPLFLAQQHQQQQQSAQQQQQQIAAQQHQLQQAAQQQQQQIDAQRKQLQQQAASSYLRSYPQAASSLDQSSASVAPVADFAGQQEPVAASSGGSPQLVTSPVEPLVAPSYEHVLSHGCPSLGVFSYPHAEHCDRYYICTNGTFTEEACPNGLSYGTQGAVYQHCAYRWNIDCGNKKAPGPIASPGCPWQFGVFPVNGQVQCSINYHECEWGVPEVKTCQPEGLFYDDRIKGCQWADQLGCKSESLLNFKCPLEDEDNAYWPFPRYYHSNKDVIVCVNEQPRLVHCSEDQLVDPASLACLDTKKKKKSRPF